MSGRQPHCDHKFKGVLAPHPHQHLSAHRFLFLLELTLLQHSLTVVFTCTFLTTKESVPLLMFLLDTGTPSSVNSPSTSFVPLSTPVQVLRESFAPALPVPLNLLAPVH